MQSSVGCRRARRPVDHWGTEGAAPYRRPDGPRLRRGAEVERLGMAVAAYRNSPELPGLMSEMRGAVGRHTGKSFDWDAFPGSRGFPELARAQMRYIGAGGSPKVDDPHTLKPGAF